MLEISQKPMNLFMNSVTLPGTHLQFDTEELVSKVSSWSVVLLHEKANRNVHRELYGPLLVSEYSSKDHFLWKELKTKP